MAVGHTIRAQRACGEYGMVITCPECGTSYRTDARSIGPQGRTVRCARCAETWFVPAADADIASKDAAARVADAAALREDMDDNLSLMLDEAPQATQTQVQAKGGRIVPPAPVGPATAVPQAAPTADVMLRDLEDARKLARRRRTIRWIWIIAALIALAGVVTAYLNRQEIVNRQPELASLYRAVGVEVRAGGLEIDPPTARTSIIDNRPVIRVDGAVRNLSNRVADLPLIELTLHGADGEALAQWFVEAPQAQLAARGRLPFTTEYVDPPIDATGLRYRFVPPQ